MSSENDDRPVSPTYMGFQRWTKISVDDFPLIRPPRRHMLSHVTGGLTELYSVITEDKKKKEEKNENENQIIETAKEPSEEQSQSQSTISPKSNINEEKSEQVKDFKETEEKNKAKKKDDEGGGSHNNDGEEMDDEEETSPYTDEEGEFAPEEGIPLLASRYKYVEVLARGQSALIVRALDTFAKDKPVAIKVLHRIYKPIGSQEADILLELHRADPWLHVPFARLQNQFIYGPHYCLVFDFLSPTPLYNHYDQRNIKGSTSLPHVRNLCVKLLTVMGFLHKQNVIHADLKPENILLVDEKDTSSVMVIDFGNALRNTEEELSLYYTDFELQTLLYRAPEVIFGLKFSLEIDMWSLGCLLAECYMGEPLFMGKTKEDILAKMTKLLGPFPKEFGEGECADLFGEFIGISLSRFERVENLRKRLNNCQDINFLLLLEKLLTYLPEKRISPFEAACHPFIASVNPFLYLSASREHKRYPTVVLDLTTYPYLPDLPDDGMQDKIFVDGRKRLARYSLTPLSINSVSNNAGEIQKPVSEQVTNHESHNNIPNSVAEECPSTVQPTSTSLPSSPQPLQNTPLSTLSCTSPIPTTSVTSTSPTSSVKLTQASKSDSVKSPSLMSPQSDSSQSSTHAKQTEKKNKDDSVIPLPKVNSNSQDPAGNFSRTDVKQTLKSMGLRCEDFTISVYSREQAHAILRKQGVEVTNHVPQKQPQQSQPQQSQPQPQPQQQQQSPRQQLTPPPLPITPPQAAKQVQRPNKSTAAPSPSVRPSVSVLRPESGRSQAPPPKAPPPKAPPPKAPTQTSKANDDDDDDDCVILDPPDGPKPPPPPRRRYPQQFQLMGTTVQVNRGAKRQMRSMSHAPMPKRQYSASSRAFFYNEGYQHEENQEASVQDTLNRLKNYNISITCRRNSSQRHRTHAIDSDSSDMDHDGSHLDSEDEEDMAKYLECEIDEEKDVSMEADDTLDLDSSGSINEVSSEMGSPVKGRNREKRKEKLEAKIAADEKLNSTVEVEEEEEKETEKKEKENEKEEEKEKEKEIEKKKEIEKEKDIEKEKEKDTEKEKEEEKEIEKEDQEQEESGIEKDTTSNENMETDDKEKEEEGAEIGETLSENAKEDNIESPRASENIETEVKESESAFIESVDPKPKESSPPHLNDNVPEMEIIEPSETSELVSKTESEVEPTPEQITEPSVSENIISSDVAENKSAEDSKLKESDPIIDKASTEDSAAKDVCDNLDDDINEELEKQLLEAGNLEDEEYEGDDMEGECIDNYELENEL